MWDRDGRGAASQDPSGQKQGPPMGSARAGRGSLDLKAVVLGSYQETGAASVGLSSGKVSPLVELWKRTGRSSPSQGGGGHGR